MNTTDYQQYQIDNLTDVYIRGRLANNKKNSIPRHLITKQQIENKRAEILDRRKRMLIPIAERRKQAMHKYNTSEHGRNRSHQYYLSNPKYYEYNPEKQTVRKKKSSIILSDAYVRAQLATRLKSKFNEITPEQILNKRNQMLNFRKRVSSTTFEEKKKEWDRIYRNKSKAIYSDSYVKTRIIGLADIKNNKLSAKDIPQELVHLKRNQLKLLHNVKKQTKSSSKH